MRISITDVPINAVVPVNTSGWDGSGQFKIGEVEDYLVADNLVHVIAAAQAQAGAVASCSSSCTAEVCCETHAQTGVSAIDLCPVIADEEPPTDPDGGGEPGGGGDEVPNTETHP